MEGSEKPLTALLSTVKLACDEMAPMVRVFYNALNRETSKLKADESLFTIADGIVQHMLTNYLFAGGKAKAIVGEESADVNILERPYTVENLVVPDDFCDIIDDVRDRVSALGARIDGTVYKDKTVFIDPIDGTREFATGLGEQCTILVGIADGEGRSVAGIIYRPTPNPSQFAFGCASERCKTHNLNIDDAGAGKHLGPPKLATTNGGISAWTEHLLQAGMDRVKSGGCGNKALLLLEGKASAYIQDRGLSRWDSCGPEAVLEAFGGVYTKLSVVTDDPDAFVTSDKATCRYTYMESKSNNDFDPGKATLTAYNAAAGIQVEKGGSKVAAMEVEQVKPYANLCGVFAVSSDRPEVLEKYAALVKIATANAQPSFD